MVSLSRVRPEADEHRVADDRSARCFGALIIDEHVLDRVLGRLEATEAGPESRPDVFEEALSVRGQLAAKQFFSAAASHAGASPRRPHGAAIGPPACPGGGADAAGFAALLAPLLPGLAPWELWDLLGPLERSDGGCVPLGGFLLVVALLAATVAGKQLQAVFALQDRLHAAFAIGGPAPLRGLRAAATLLGAPPARLHAAAERLGLGGGGGGAVAPEEAALVLYAALRGSGSGGGCSSGGGAHQAGQPPPPAAAAEPGCCGGRGCWPRWR